MFYRFTLALLASLVACDSGKVGQDLSVMDTAALDNETPAGTIGGSGTGATTGTGTGLGSGTGTGSTTVNTGTGTGSMPATGETCTDAIDLTGSSTPTAGSVAYSHQLGGAFAATDDYNPLGTSGMAPGCALVFDSVGADMVFSITLQPGETLSTRLTLSPDNAIPSMYLMEGCPVNGWPDVDGSGSCGNNEYATDGFCSIGICYPLEWTFTWPTHDLKGTPNTSRTFYLVADEVNGSNATDYLLEWGISS